MQFLQAVVDNMKVHFPDQQFLAAGAVLSPSTWPSDEDQLAVYGDSDVIKLARLLQVDTVQAVDQFRTFKNNRCKVGRVRTVKFNATRRAFAIVFSRMRKRVFFNESER